MRVDHTAGAASPGRARLVDSPGALAIAGTLAIHALVAIVGDVLIVALPPTPYVRPPHVELVDIEVPAVVTPLPPPPQIAPTPQTPPPPQTTPPVQHRVAKSAPTPQPQPPEPLTPTPTLTPTTGEGGAPVTTMEDIAPSATGVAVAKGPRTEHVGRGGTGTGTGSGSGTGNSETTPTSIATIKSRAMPKGDFSYFDASKDYPAEARSLGIEGVIRVRLVVDDGGKVKSALLLNKLGHGLDELALERAKKIVFDPAKDTDDKPVSSVVIWSFNMTLPK